MGRRQVKRREPKLGNRQICRNYQVHGHVSYPEYRMDRKGTTVADVWRKYFANTKRTPAWYYLVQYADFVKDTSESKETDLWRAIDPVNGWQLEWIKIEFNGDEEWTSAFNFYSYKGDYQPYTCSTLEGNMSDFLEGKMRGLKGDVWTRGHYGYLK